MAKQRITEEFVNHLNRLKEATSNNPENLAKALDIDGALNHSIDELERIYRILESHRKFGKTRYISQSHIDFSNSKIDYEQFWKAPLEFSLLWRVIKDNNKSYVDSFRDPFRIDIDNLLVRNSSSSPEGADNSYGCYEDDEWELDPDAGSVTSDLCSIIEMCRNRADPDDPDSNPDYLRGAQAYDWFENILGDFDEIERRWKYLKITSVPKHVSDPHDVMGGITGLYRLLEDAQKAYVVGAQLASIAMCRTLTELVLKQHYPLATKCNGLADRVKKSQKQYETLKVHNLNEKKNMADGVLHANPEKARFFAGKEEQILRGWFDSIKAIIEQAPNG